MIPLFPAQNLAEDQAQRLSGIQFIEGLLQTDPVSCIGEMVEIIVSLQLPQKMVTVHQRREDVPHPRNHGFGISQNLLIRIF